MIGSLYCWVDQIWYGCRKAEYGKLWYEENHIGSR